MKKIICLLLVFALCLPLCACGGEESVNVGETYTMGDITFKVTRIRYSPQITRLEKKVWVNSTSYQEYYFDFDHILQPTTSTVDGVDLIAESGKTFMIIDFEVKSNGQTEVTDFDMELNFSGKKTFACYGEYSNAPNDYAYAPSSGVELGWYEGYKFRSYAECYTQVQTDTSAKVWLDVTINGESFKVNIR